MATASVEPTKLSCNDRLLERCKGVVTKSSDGRVLANALSLALEALDVCIGRHDELAVCVEEFRADQEQQSDKGGAK